MKKDRDCGCGQTPYPIYPNYQMPNMMTPGMVPMQGMGMPINPYMNNSMPTTNSNTMNQMGNIEEQINILDRRITRLENTINDFKMNQYGNTNNYSDSNYHMM